MATLYEINQSVRKWKNKVIAQEGELTEEDLQELASLEVQSEDKIEAYAVIIKELKAEEEMYDNEMKRLEKKKGKRRAMSGRMTVALNEFMQQVGKDKFVSIKAQISYRKSVAVDIEENAKVPKKFMRIKSEADKTAIKKYLQEGNKLKGCQIVERKNIQIN